MRVGNDLQDLISLPSPRRLMRATIEHFHEAVKNPKQDLSKAFGLVVTQAQEIEKSCAIFMLVYMKRIW